MSAKDILNNLYLLSEQVRSNQQDEADTDLEDVGYCELDSDGFEDGEYDDTGSLLYAFEDGLDYIDAMSDFSMDEISEFAISSLNQLELPTELKDLLFDVFDELQQTNQAVLLGVFTAGILLGRQIAQE